LLSTLPMKMKHDATDRFMRDTIRCTTAGNWEAGIPYEGLCWLLEASAEKMDGLISSVTSYLNASHARKA